MEYELCRLPACRQSDGRARQTAEEGRSQPGKIKKTGNIFCKIFDQTCQVSFARETLTLEASDSLAISSQSASPTSPPPPPF